MTLLYQGSAAPQRGLWTTKPGLMGAILFGLLYLKLIISFDVELGMLGPLNYVLDILIMPLIALVLFCYHGRLSDSARLSVAALLGFTLYLVIQGGLYGQPGATTIYYTRFVLPLLLYYSLLLCSVNHRARTNWLTENLVLLVFLLGLVGLWFMPETSNHDEAKLPTYFGNLHKSAYIFSVALIVGSICLRNLSGSRRLALAAMMVFAIYMLIDGWSIRTPLVLIAVYAGVLVMSRFGATGKSVLYLLVPVLVIALAALSADSINWNRVSSGRLNMWQIKLQMLSGAELHQFIFGRGFGSDHIRVDNWMGEKDSHNNFLQTITELGLVGLIFLVANITLLYRTQPNLYGRALVLGYTATGLFSNGIIYRLLPGYMFAIALAYITLAASEQRRKIPMRNGGFQGV
ncbi:hypothetical protein [Haliea sp. E17]|uniref:hypothetical protein n=1 Tax=Haliea sp. E17 TaxID=3401576 RepID=UPI003AAD20AE